MLQIGHFWLYLKLFAQLDNRLTTKIPKVDDRLVIKTKITITILVFLALQRLNLTSDGLSES